MLEQIKKMFEEQKRGKIKAIIVFLIVYVLMMGFISFFYGNPFPHKEKIVFIEVMQYGWIHTHGYLLLLCVAVGLIMGLGSILYKIMLRFKRFDDILLHKCDTKEYLKIMEIAVSYGKGIHFKGYQKVVFSFFQQRYVLAMNANWKLEEAQRYLEDEWIGSKNARIYKKLTLNRNLIALYQSHDVKGFCAVCQEAGKSFQKNRLLVAEKFILQKQHKEAKELLCNQKEKTLYNEVCRNYLLGICYDALGEQKKAEESMKFVKVYGNTSPYKDLAQKWQMEDAIKTST